MPANQTVTIHGVIPNKLYTGPAANKVKAVFGLGFPLGEEFASGGYFRKRSNIEIIKDAVRQLIETEPGERVMLPRFGCRLRRYLFQPLDEETFESIKKEILFSFENYIVGATILRLRVEPTNITGPSGGNSLRIVLQLRLDEDELSIFEVEATIQ